MRQGLTFVKIKKIEHIKKKYIKFYHTLHKDMWNYLYENPNKDKKDWPRWVINGGDIKIVNGNCFACEYDYKFNDICNHCPFDIGIGDYCLKGLYRKWILSNDLEERKQLAKQIRDFPVKKGIKCI